MKKLFASTLAISLLASCAMIKPANQSNEESLDQVENQLITFEKLYLKLISLKQGEVNEKTGDVEITLFIDLPGSSYSGKSGCNSYFGSIEKVTQDQIKINMGGSTEMMCKDDLMLWEATYYKAIMDKTFSVTESESVVLFSEVDGNTILSFEKVNTVEE
jgi:heat shock protein HslJ